MPNQPVSSLLRFSVLAITLILGAVSAVAQLSTATITGVVQDTSNAVVPGATVTVTQTATNFTTRAVSGDNGVFSIPSLPVGPYTLSVAAKSFAPYEQTGIVLTVGQVANIQVTLKVGSIGEKITVTANTNAVESTESTIQNTVEERVVTDLPLNGRNPASLVDTTAGVSNPNQNAGQGQLASLNQVVPAGSNPGSITISTHGVRSGGTYYSLDGASNVDPSPVIGGPFPDPDATQEFSVVTGTYGARYISAPGGAVNIVTKSGTNAIHGSLFEFIRNGYVNAENALLAQPDTLKRNQYGATIGAPIIKNRWFVFGSYQGSRIRATAVNVYPVPNADERAGTFTTVEGQPYQFSSLIPALNNINPFIPWANIVGPLLVPSSVNANFYNYLGSGSPLIPLANHPSNGTLVVGVPTPTDEEQYVIKTEFVFGKHRAFARWFSDHYTGDAIAEPTSAPYNVFDTAGGGNSYWDNYAVGDTWVSGNLILDTRLSFLNIYNRTSSPAANEQFNLPAMGAINYSEPPGAAGIGIEALGQTVPPSASGTGKIPRSSLDLSEDVIYMKGKHQVSFGGDIRHIYYAQSNPAGQTGVLEYLGAFSSGALPGMLAGIFQAAGIPLNLLPLPPLVDSNFIDFYFGHPTVFIQSDGIFNSGTAYMYGFYGEDKYRATQRLTVTAGLRWDPYLPATPKHNQIDCWNPGVQSTVYPNTPEGITYHGDPNCPAGGTTAKYKGEFQPRIGFGYQLDKKGNTALRAGYGVYDIQVPLATVQGFSAFPFVRTYIVPNPFQNIGNIWGTNGTTNPFAAGFQGWGYTPPSSAVFPTPTPTFPVAANIGALAKNFTPGYVQQWSVSLQHQITNYDSVELAYVGTKGTKLAQSYDANLPVYFAGEISAGQEQATRPYNTIGSIYTMAPIGNSNYNGLDVTYKHRAKSGLGIVSAFSWSRCIDNGSTPASTGGATLDQYQPEYFRGLCDFDENLTWRTTATWMTPAFSGHGLPVRTVLGSWAVSGLLTMDAGQPFSVPDGTDRSFTGLANVADRVPGVPLYVNGRLNYYAFKDNAPGTFGDSGRNSFRSKKNADLDMALMKNFKFTERWRMMLRGEVFNLLNHPNYFNPNTTLDNTSPQTFGIYTYARDPRQLQLALKIMF